MTATLSRAETTAALLDRAIEALTDRGACPNCCHPVHSSNGKTWVHTLTGLYRCPPGIGAGGDGWAAPPDVTDREEAEQAAYEDGFAEGQTQCEDDHYTIEDDAKAEGREDMHREIKAALDGVLDSPALAVSGLRLDDVRAALTEAWNTVTP